MRLIETALKIRKFSAIELATLVYFAYFHSYILYSILLCGDAGDIIEYMIMQMRAPRAIDNLGPRCF